MLTDEVVAYFQRILAEPADPEPREAWLGGGDILAFLEGSIGGHIPAYFSRHDFFLCVVMVPEERLAGAAEEDLLRWNMGVEHGWGVQPSRRDDGTVVGSVYPPGHVSGSTTLADPDFVAYRRRFPARVPDEAYLELNQRLAHLADLHWLPERRAYCRLDDEGDVVEAVRIHDGPGLLCTIEDRTLHRYLVATGQVAVRLFDAGRVSDPTDADAAKPRSAELVRHGSIVARREEARGPRRGRRVAYRGYQVLRPPSDPAERTCLLGGGGEDDERYHPFLIQELKNGRVRRYPADGDDADAPDEWPDLLSPAFFRPAVLDRYKADPDKYLLTRSMVERRGGWFLRSYDVNAAGQVYAYLKDLWSLPYREQQHWALHNEAPKACITDRSVVQDFLNRPWTGPDPIRDLRRALRSFPAPSHNGVPTPVWALKTAEEERALTTLREVQTGSRKEWADQTLALAKIVVEGLQEKPLRALARARGFEDPKVRSLGLLRECLTRSGLPDADAAKICDPLRELNRRRSAAGIAHAGGGPTNQDLRRDFGALLVDVAAAMTALADQVREGRFDLPPRVPTDDEGHASPR